MLVAHAAATVLTALLLARGERALARLLTLLNAPLRRLAAAVGMGPRRATAVVRTADGWRDVVRLASAVLDGAGGRRGPPVWSAAATR
jgi:hypothetical protein